MKQTANETDTKERLGGDDVVGRFGGVSRQRPTYNSANMPNTMTSR